MLGECFKIVDLKCQVGDIRADVNRAAAIELAYFDLFFALRGFEEDEFRAAWGFQTVDLFETKYVFIERNSFIQIGYSIPGVKEFLNHTLENWHKWIAWAINS